MIRIVIIQQPFNLSDEAAEFQLNDRISFRRFCLLRDSSSIPDRTTLWFFRERIGEAGAESLFEAVQQEPHRHVYMARCGQLIDASIVSAPIQHVTRKEKEVMVSRRCLSNERLRCGDSAISRRVGQRSTAELLRIQAKRQRRQATQVHSLHHGVPSERSGYTVFW